MDYWARASAIYETMQRIMNLDFSSNDPKYLAVRNPQVRDAAADVIGGFSAFTLNSVSDTYNVGAGLTNWAAGSEQIPYAPRYTPERTGGRLFYYSANVASVGRLGFGLYNGVQTIRSGGLSFAAYRALQGPSEILGIIPTMTRSGRIINYAIRTEQSHMFITQSMQRAHNLPNWLVNNRINVWKLNSVQHALIDSQRYKFLPVGSKPDVGFFGKYNFFTRNFK